MNRAHHKAGQIAKKSASTARQNLNQIQRIRQANQATMRRTTAIGAQQMLNKDTQDTARENEGDSLMYLIMTLIILGCWVAGVGFFLVGAPLLGVIALIGCVMFQLVGKLLNR